MKIDSCVRVGESLFEIPVTAKKGMRVPARVYASEEMLRGMDQAVFEQVTNVAFLPGIRRYALCMPDGHSGYGFPIGGVAAIDPDEGVISPGGIGFDINCGIRLLATSLGADEVRPRLEELVNALFAAIPSGVGGEGLVRLSHTAFNRAVSEGAPWALKNGWAEPDDIDHTEDGGSIEEADAGAVSEKAFARGKNQLGTLGSGNHFLEIQVAEDAHIVDRRLAAEYGITGGGQVCVMIHCGSRGYGHQIATDYLQRFSSVMGKKYGLSMPDRELSCAPFRSEDGQEYYRAMNCAINFAYLNRQIIMHTVREVFSRVFRKSPDRMGMRLVYDVCHNTAKLETHVIDGKPVKLLVHRKGATRAFPPGRKELPEAYRSVGQPVIIGGSMQSGSYLLSGAESSADSFYTTAHGSGRLMSRTQAKKSFRGRDLLESMRAQGIYVQTASLSGLAEEAGDAYKDIDQVVRASESAGLRRAVAKLVPIGNIKG
jgi:tRNA-splicing ligase RtcB